MFTICVFIYANAFTSVPFIQECRSNQSAVAVSQEIRECNRAQQRPEMMCAPSHIPGSTVFSFKLRRLWTE